MNRPNRLGRSLTCNKVIRRPWPTHHHLYSRQVAGCRLIAILVLFYLLVVNEMGNVNEHSPGFSLAAADILIQRIEDLVYLD